MKWLKSIFCLLPSLCLFCSPLSAEEYIQVTKTQWTSIVQLSQKLGSCIENQSEQIESLEQTIVSSQVSIVNLKQALTSSATLLIEQESKLEASETEMTKQKDSYVSLTLTYNQSKALNKILGISLGVVGTAAIIEALVLYFQRR